jgi:hypothetical protein
LADVERQRAAGRTTRIPGRSWPAAPSPAWCPLACPNGDRLQLPCSVTNDEPAAHAWRRRGVLAVGTPTLLRTQKPLRPEVLAGDRRDDRPLHAMLRNGDGSVTTGRTVARG